jgi:hypothetical protein
VDAVLVEYKHEGMDGEAVAYRIEQAFSWKAITPLVHRTRHEPGVEVLERGVVVNAL